MNDIEKGIELGITDQHGSPESPGRGMDILITTNELREIQDKPDKLITQKIGIEDLGLLASATDQELKDLAGKTTVNRVEMTDSSVEPTVEFGEITAHPPTKLFPDNDLAGGAFLNYLELRAKAQTVLGWELPKEELN